MSLATPLSDAPGQRPMISQMPYLPGLDGLRALAVVAVMVYHADHDWLKGGYLGVEVFFVISGYLITLLLIGEHERTGHVDLRMFWLRRFRRLLPAVFVMMALLVVYLMLFFRDGRYDTRGDVVAGAFYSANWWQIFVGGGYTAAEAFAPLRHLWSLAVEEQFYLVWPVVMAALLRGGRRRLPLIGVRLFATAAALAVLIAVLYVPGSISSECADESRGYWMLFGRCVSVNNALYLSTFTRAGGLMLGAAMAMLWRPKAILRGPLRSRAPLLDGLAVFGLGVLAMLMWFVGLASRGDTLTSSAFDPWFYRGGLFATGLATMLVIAAVTHRAALTGNLLGHPLLVWVGTRSYGLYLYHWPVYQLIRKEAGRSLGVGQFVFAIVVTVVLTETSFRVIEMPIRRRGLMGVIRGPKPEWVPAAAFASVAMVAFSVVGMAIAPKVCLGEVNRTLCAADAAEAAASSTEPPPGSTESTTLQPGTSSSTTTSTIPFAARAPVAIGESVMRGALPQLQAAGFAVYAEENKGPNWVRETLATLRTNNSLGPTVVVQVGTNGPVSQEQYDAIMAELADATTVVFLTIKAPVDHAPANNERINALPQRYPNVRVLDWANVGARIESELSRNDGGIHLRTTKAQQFYANAIFEQVGRPDLVVSLDDV
jgi:peptidoglycan/LPS O-acetylase OafA/YrhL